MAIFGIKILAVGIVSSRQLFHGIIPRDIIPLALLLLFSLRARAREERRDSGASSENFDRCPVALITQIIRTLRILLVSAVAQVQVSEVARRY